MTSFSHRTLSFALLLLSLGFASCSGGHGQKVSAG